MVIFKTQNPFYYMVSQSVLTAPKKVAAYPWKRCQITELFQLPEDLPIQCTSLAHITWKGTDTYFSKSGILAVVETRLLQ